MRNFRYFGFLFLLPLIIGVPISEKDSSEMSIKVVGGIGSYAYIHRGCKGEVLDKENAPFKDAGFSIDYKFKAPLKIGLRSGYILEKQLWYDHTLRPPTSKHRNNVYVNPNFAFEGKSFGIGFGPFFAQKDLYVRESKWGRTLPSWHLRFGSPKLYFSIHMLESVPLYSGGGYLNFGLGGASRKVSYWYGLGTRGPYDAAGFLAKTNFKLNQNWHLDLVGRLGTSAGISESAVSIGLNYRFITK